MFILLTIYLFSKRELFILTYQIICLYLPSFLVALINPNAELKRNFSRKNVFNLCSALRDIKWNFDSKSANEMCCLFLSKYLEFLNYYCPLRPIKFSKKVDELWLTQNLIACCHMKQYLYKQALKYPDKKP